MGIRVGAVHSAVLRAGDNVPEMADDRVDEECFAKRVPIHPPRVRGALRDDLDFTTRGMESPNTHAHCHALVLESATAFRQAQGLCKAEAI